MKDFLNEWKLVIGFIASFPDDTLYSFNVETMTLVDPDGVALPPKPDRIAIAGDRIAIADSSDGRIFVCDVSDPSDMVFVGSIGLQQGTTFGSNDNIVFADDGVTGFITSNQRRLFSFDVTTLDVLDQMTIGSEQIIRIAKWDNDATSLPSTIAPGRSGVASSIS